MTPTPTPPPIFGIHFDMLSSAPSESKLHEALAERVGLFEWFISFPFLLLFESGSANIGS